MNADRTVDLERLMNRLWRRRRLIGGTVIVATLLTALAAFLLPPWFRAQASLLPPAEEESGLGLARLLRGVAVPGVTIPGQATLADVFLAVLESRRINEEVVKRFDLKNLYRRRLVEDALRELAQHTEFTLTEAGTIEIAVEDRDPKRAAEMANAYVELLDRFNRDVRMTKGRRTRLFVEARLDETKSELAAAEQSLAEYQSQHKTVVITPEMSSAAETAGRIFAERTALQIRLGVVRSYSRGGTDEELQIQQQLAQLDQQLRSLPESGLQLVRLLREVRTQEQLYILLIAQYEEARINEVRDVTTLEVLDRAAPPERKSRPKRGLMIAAAFLVSAGVVSAYAMFQEDDGVITRTGAPAAG
jgi:uncharacterized protein involved in exopolysaccharide biosynthesis